MRSAKSSSFVTSLSLPMPLIDLAKNNSGYEGCLGGFWAAYVRGIQLIKVAARHKSMKNEFIRLSFLYMRR